jgi:Pyruvate/2-oxoacid:ferredoxin oxidoreductase delta subunit
MNKRIVFCNCGGKLVESHRLTEISGYLNQQGIPFIKISDLCGVCSTQKDEIRNLLNTDGEILIIACYPRAVRLLLNESGIDTERAAFTYLNFREMNNQILFDQIQSFKNGDTFQPVTTELASNPDWLSWFPVIDYSRCNSCGQCADFCLFGVYEKRDEKVLVVNPKGCKSNCPACGRICPQTAIVFPKYGHGGAIAGADSFNEIEEQQRQQRDINSILGSDIYNSLEQRKLKRQSIIRHSEMQNALRERDKALNERGEH